MRVVTLGAPAQGGLALLDNGWVLYAPPTGGDENDQFSYAVMDAEGAEAVATVYVVRIAPGTEPARNQLGVPVTLSDGKLLLRFAGIAGRTYTVEYTDRLGDPWQPLPDGNALVAGPTGILEVIDEHPSPSQRYYRTVAD